MRVAVVGATGAVGQTTLKLLDERKFPVTELHAFASQRSAGAAQFKEYAPRAVKAGAVVVDKSSAFRMDPTVPLVVPGR
jgi:aspartate-semialdehyde dehydrogenase